MKNRVRTFGKKEKFTFTINSARGIRQVTLGQLARRFLTVSILVVLSALVIGSFLINFLYEEVTALNDKKAKLTREYREANNELQNLQMLLNEKNMQLSQVEAKISDIEMMVGLKPQKDEHLIKRVDIAKLTAAEKRFMLENIPSGYPLQYRGITSKYGYRIHPIVKRKEFHTGVDLKGGYGTPVYATANGIVEFSGYHKKSGYGNLLIVDHNFGFKTMYGHLKSIAVDAGTFVKKGDLIGHVGSTGLSSGPHLHYEVRHIQKTINPMRFMQWDMENYEQVFEKQRRINWDSLLKAAKSAMKIAQR